MVKCTKRVAICLLFTAIIWTAGVLSDGTKRKEVLIPPPAALNQVFGVDRQVRHRIWETLSGSIQSDIRNVLDMNMARTYLRENVPGFLDMLKGTLGQDIFVNPLAPDLRKTVLAVLFLE